MGRNMKLLRRRRALERLIVLLDGVEGVELNHVKSLTAEEAEKIEKELRRVRATLIECAPREVIDDALAELEELREE